LTLGATPVDAGIERAAITIREGDDSGFNSGCARCPASSCHRRRLMVVLTSSPRRMWTLTRDDVATKPKRDIHTTQSMFKVMWNPLGFHVVAKLPSGPKMNSDYFTTNIFAPLEQKMFQAGRRPRAKRLSPHVDHCSIHMSSFFRGTVPHLFRYKPIFR
jgi:hypothetical protein